MYRFVFALITGIALGLAGAPKSARANIWIVTNTLANGPGSLAQAITDANANPGADIIGFNISGNCPRTIALGDATPLPAIIDSLSIRGYTQPGASANSSEFGDNATICIQLRTISGDTVQNGLRFAPIDISANFDVSGLSIGGFNDGIRIEGGNYTIAGNFIGLDADGVTRRTNHYNGIRVQASTAYIATTRLIGGTAAADRNVISENGTGVALYGGAGNLVRNNFIGTTRSGNAAASNGNGIFVANLSNEISDNVVSGNSGAAIRIEGANAAANYVSLNKIGVKSFTACFPPPCPPGTENLGNMGEGIRIAAGAAGNFVALNTIAWNDGDGISLPDAGPLNELRANSMHDNSGLGIDLGADGVDAIDNDAIAPAGVPNRLLNFPVLDSAGGGELGGTVNGFLQSTNGHYVIEFYADTLLDPSLHGEGRDYLGYGEVDIVNAPAGNNGAVQFHLAISDSVSLVGRHISALAVDADGNTSEFSEGRTYTLNDTIFADGFD